MPPHLAGLRTIFNGFHHLQPWDARSVLHAAAAARQPIAIFEVSERSLRTLPVVLTPLFVWLVTPFMRPFLWQRLFWTYLLPLVPLTCLWDGIVSQLRAYTLGRAAPDVRRLGADDLGGREDSDRQGRRTADLFDRIPRIMKRLALAAALVLLGIGGLTVASQRSATAMAGAANKWLTSLTPEQRQKAAFAFDSDERLKWHFIPNESFPRNGLTFKEMTEPQRAFAPISSRPGSASAAT